MIVGDGIENSIHDPVIEAGRKDRGLGIIQVYPEHVLGGECRLYRIATCEIAVYWDSIDGPPVRIPPLDVHEHITAWGQGGIQIRSNLFNPEQDRLFLRDADALGRYRLGRVCKPEERRRP